MANDENKIILEFPATNVEIEFGETITFDNISGFLDSGRVTYNGESLTEEIAHLENDKADTTYVDEQLNLKMDKANPTGTGSFSLNRKANTTVGSYSVTTGYRNTASGTASHSESWQTTASGDASHAEGESTIASAYAAHSEGETTTASGDDSHAEGKNSTASGNVSHAEGENNTASGYGSHAEGYGNTASGLMAHAEGITTESSGYGSHSEGVGTIANHIGQHVFGAYNVADTSTAQPTAKGNYIEIVGNGTDDDRRRNARTLDWSGNETLMGDLTYNGNKSLTSEISRLDGRIDNLPSPMIFKGTLGVGGTIQTLPAASASNEGYTYKVITDGTYAEQTAKVGDVFTSNGSAWVLIPSGDEDNDTWRAIKVEGVEVLGNGISSGAVDFVGSENIEVDYDGNGNKVGVKTKNIYTKEEVDEIIYNILPTKSASGAIANFNTSLALPLKSLEADVNAVQGLHGYDHPWVGGAGKNLVKIVDFTDIRGGITRTCVASAETVSVSGTADVSGGRNIRLTDIIHLKAGTYILSKTTVSGSIKASYIVSNTVGGYISGASFTLNEDTDVIIGANVVEGTTYNEVVHLQIEKGSTATDWTPYENICPISGWSEISLVHRGKNLWGGTLIDGDVPLDLKPNMTYTFSAKNITGTNAYLFVRRSTDGVNFELVERIINATNVYVKTITIEEGYIYSLWTNANSLSRIGDVQIELGTVEEPTYEPYNGTTTPYTLPQTVYGGEIVKDKTGGVLRITHALADLGSLNWVYVTDARRWRAIKSGMKSYPSRSNDVLFEKYATDITASAGSENGGYIAQTYIYVHSTDNTNAPTGNCVYPLATPIEIPLSDLPEIVTKQGINNIWVDTGDIAVDYKCSVEDYIEEEIASVQALTLNT